MAAILLLLAIAAMANTLACNAHLLIPHFFAMMRCKIAFFPKRQAQPLCQNLATMPLSQKQHSLFARSVYLKTHMTTDVQVTSPNNDYILPTKQIDKHTLCTFYCHASNYLNTVIEEAR